LLTNHGGVAAAFISFRRTGIVTAVGVVLVMIGFLDLAF
jgi:hypothetical protein